MQQHGNICFNVSPTKNRNVKVKVSSVVNIKN